MISAIAARLNGPRPYFLLSAGIILLDQLSKWAALAALKDAGGKIEVLPFFNIVMVWNYGVSFGLFNQKTAFGPGLLVLLSLAITVWFARWLLRSACRVQRIALAMVIGGALGNVIDRMRYGAVVDFLDLHAFGYHWPAFNVADSCIVLGVAGLILHSIFMDKPAAEEDMKTNG